MLHQELLDKVVAADPTLAEDAIITPVVREFSHVLCPAIMRKFAGIPALGGAGTPLSPEEAAALPAGAQALDDTQLERFSQSHADQSLATHLINGVFAGFRLAVVSSKASNALTWTELEWRVWVLGFVLHDYGKARRVDVPASRMDAARTICRELGQQLHFGDYLPHLPPWEDYLGDILFLAQNTQKLRGALLDPSAFGARLHPRRLMSLRTLASFADVLVHVTEPRDVAARSAESSRPTHVNLQQTLKDLFGAEASPRLAYHQVAEVRGLLTNLIHNAVQEVLKDRKFQPYLYFSDGMVYITSDQAKAEIEPAEVVDRVWTVMRRTLTRNRTFGLDRDGKGIKVAPPLYELHDAGALLSAGKTYALNITNAVSSKRLDKYGVGNLGLPTDVRVDRLAEFLVYLKRHIAGSLFGEANGVTAFLLAHIELTGVVSPVEVDRQEGGVPLGWFYAAAQFMNRHKGLADHQLPDLFDELGNALLAELERQGLTGLRRNTLRLALEMYITNVLDIDGFRTTGEAARAILGAELASYVTKKASNRAVCSLCSTPYDSQEQTETVVLFKPQQYSTKNRLGGSRVTRGICPICSLEMLLRQAVQEVPGGKFQDQRPTYLTLYPAYFFTPETAELVKQCAGRLKDLKLYLGADSLLASLRRASDKGALNVESLLDYEGFLADEDDEEMPRKRRTIRPTYSEHEVSGLVIMPFVPYETQPTDTDAWILPALFALALPLLLNVKTVASSSFVPLYPSAGAFRATAVLDGLHPAIRLALAASEISTSGTEFRVEQIEPALKRLLAIYDLHSDVFAQGYDAHWGQLAAVARDVVTDPYNVFAYYDRKKRTGTKGIGGGQTTDGVSPWDQDRYMDIYLTMKGRHSTLPQGEHEMGTIGSLVDSYTGFYLTQSDKLSSAYAVLKPLAMAIDVTLNSSPSLDRDDLVETISGALHDLMERVRDKQADGWDPVLTNVTLGTGADRMEISRQRIHEFAERFVRDLFLGECRGDRAMLRERASQLRSAARFYYLTHYTPRSMARRGTAQGAGAASGESDKE